MDIAISVSVFFYTHTHMHARTHTHTHTHTHNSRATGPWLTEYSISYSLTCHWIYLYGGLRCHLQSLLDLTPSKLKKPQNLWWVSMTPEDRPCAQRQDWLLRTQTGSCHSVSTQFGQLLSVPRLLLTVRPKEFCLFKWLFIRLGFYYCKT